MSEPARRLSFHEASFIPDVALLNPEWSLFLIQSVVILTISRLMSTFAEYINQPPVIFEIMGGIILGPSVLGTHAGLSEILFPKESFETLELIASLGLMIYMFLMGLDLNPEVASSNVVQSVIIACLSVILPFIMGVFISELVCTTLQEDEMCKMPNIISFYIFLSSAMSITAFPVLARILTDSKLTLTRVGAVVLQAAAVNDVIAYLLLIVAVALANNSKGEIAGYVIMYLLLYIVAVFGVIKYVLEYAVRRFEATHNDKQSDNNIYSLVFLTVLLSGWYVTQLGLDPFIGAFLLGVVVPRGTRLHANCLQRMHDFFLTLFLPLYFAYVGLRTDFSKMQTYPDLPLLVLLITLSSLGKFIGAGLPAYYFGFDLRESAAIAVLMNTRGLIELIVLNIGRDTEILNERCHSLLVVMCLTTTFLTGPIMQCLYPEHVRVKLDHVDPISEHCDDVVESYSEEDGLLAME